MEDTVYSFCLALYNCTFMNHTVPDKQIQFYKLYKFCLAFLTNNLLILFNCFYTLHIKFLIRIVFSVLLGLAKGVRMNAV